MKVDEQLETLCKEFAGLEEPEKDYILGVSEALSHSVYEKNSIFLPVTGVHETNISRNITIFNKEYRA
jgi:hypothetical protein